MNIDAVSIFRLASTSGFARRPQMFTPRLAALAGRGVELDHAILQSARFEKIRDHAARHAEAGDDDVAVEYGLISCLVHSRLDLHWRQ